MTRPPPPVKGAFLVELELKKQFFSFFFDPLLIPLVLPHRDTRGFVPPVLFDI